MALLLISTCFLRAENVKTWGGNPFGQLGLNNTTDASSPTTVGSNDQWRVVAAGFIHTLAVKYDGTLWAWGGNGTGQLGRGVGNFDDSLVPVQIGTATTWAKVCAAGSTSLGIQTDGSLWAWGDNSSGALGLGNTTNLQVPTRVGTGNDWASVSTSSGHTVAVKTDGTLWSWGSNNAGQLGDGGTTDRSSPAQVGTDTNWALASAGQSNFTLAVKTTGTLWAWGNNSFGQLGTGTGNVSVPTQVGSATDWASASAGLSHSIAVKTTGQLWVWGDNAFGQLGRGNTNSATSPVRIGSATDWAKVSAGDYHSAAIKTSGQLWAWGNNGAGQVGDGTTDDRLSPVRVGAATDWQSVSAGSGFNAGTSGQPPSAEIAVSGNSQSITSGDTTPDTADHTDFGSVTAAGSGTVVRTFTVSNSGGVALNLTGNPKVAISGTNAADFSVTAQPSSSLAALTGSTSFQVTFNPSAVGLRSATLSLANNDSDEDPFTFAIQGTGENSPPSDITLTSSSIAENAGANAIVGTVGVVDPDFGAFALNFVSGEGDADNDAFTFLGGDKLRLKASADFETKSSYSVRIQTDDGQGGSYAEAFTINITNVNEMPSFTKGADQSIPNTTTAQTVPGWATGINDGDSTVTQGLSFNVSVTSGGGIFTTAPSVSSAGVLSYTPNGIAGTATLSITLTDDGTINSTAALITAAQTFTITVLPPGPSITSISTPAGSYNAGKVLSFTVNFSVPVTVTGTPRLALTIGSTTKLATYLSGSGSSALVFTYTVAAGENDPDGIALTSPLQLNGGSIKDSLGTDSALAFALPDTSGVLVDTTPPTVSSVVFLGTFPLNQNPLLKDHLLGLKVTMSEPIVAPSDTDRDKLKLELMIGSAKVLATATGSDADAINFAYQIKNLENDLNGISVPLDGFKLNGGLITDAAGNALASPNHTAVPDNSNFRVDTKAPTLTGLPTAVVTIPEDAGVQTVPLNVSDGGSNIQPLTLTAISSNTALIPNPTITHTTGQTTATLTYQPVADAFGTAEITVNVAENIPSGGQSAAPQKFKINVTPVNDPPRMTMPVPASVTLDETTGQRSFVVTGINAGPNETGDLRVKATLSNDLLMRSKAPTTWYVRYSKDTASATVFYTLGDLPLSGSASSDFTVTVSELSDPNQKTTGTYTITVNAVNDAPTLDGPASITVLEDAAETEVEFNVSPGGGEVQQTLTPSIVSSSNTGLLPVNNATFALVPGSTTKAKLKFKPAANQSGTATIKLRVQDNGLNRDPNTDPNGVPNVNFVEKDFTVTVTSVDDAPSFVVKPSVKVAPATGAKTEADFVTGFNANDAGQTLRLNGYKVQADKPNLFTAQPAIDTTGTLTFTPGTTSGSAECTVTAYDSGSSDNGNQNSSSQTFNIVIGDNAPPSFELEKSWTEANLSAEILSNCFVATSADGSKLVTVTEQGHVFTSTTSGASWIKRPLAPKEKYRSVASSANGTKLVALAAGGGAIYSSGDSGDTWTQQLKVPDNVWTSVASSDDGRNLVVLDGGYGVRGGKIYTSEDGGINWQARGETRTWTSVASSADGSKLVAVAGLDSNRGKIYTSIDSGKTWTAKTKEDRAWFSVASSGDGRKLVASGDGGLFTSTNSGASWKKQASIVAFSLASSADGTKLVAGGQGQMFTSNDSGTTWTGSKVGGRFAFFLSVASSADGNKLVAGSFGGGQGVYTLDQTYNQTVADSAGVQAQFNFVKNVKDEDAGQTLTFNVTNDRPDLFNLEPTITHSFLDTLTYTPKPGTSGTATVTVRLNDGVVDSAPQTFTITVIDTLETSSYAGSPSTTIPLNGQTLQNDSGAAQTLTNPVHLSGNSAIGGANTLTLTNVTLTDDATLSVGPGGLGLGAGFTSNPAGKTLVKTGPGPLYLNASSFNGNIEVLEGEVILLGIMPNGKVTLGAGSTLKGVGNIFATFLKPGSTISPGASPGMITSVTGTWEGGFTYDWEINRADGTAGIDPGWDYLNHTGTLTINATAENPIQLNLQTLTAANAAGDMVNFNPQSAYAWKIASAAGGITGFDAAAFKLDSSGFTNATPGGRFGIALQNAGKDLVVTYTPKLVQGRYAWTNDASSGISTANGTLWARRFGVDRPCQIGGVDLIPTGYVVTSPDFDLAGSDQNYNNDDTNNLTSLTGQGSAELAKRFVYNGNPMVLTFKRLIPGRTYVVTILSVGFDSSPGVRWQTFSSGSDTWRVDASAYGLDVGSRFEYHFTADAPTRVLTITPDNAGNSFALYGLALRPGPNTPPTFALRDQPNQSVILGSGAQAVERFASGMTAGAETYDEGQTVSFEVTTDRPDLFSEQPEINDDGDLTYTPMSGRTGVAKVTVVAVDSGFTQNRSAPVTFTLTIGLPPAPNWSWEGGPNTPKQKGTYPATAGGTGSPGSRLDAATWSDGAGKLYLYGGFGYGDSLLNTGILSDLWSCDLNTTPPVWTWLGGSKTLNAAPNHGTKGVAASTNTPGSRTRAVTWRDASGNLWLFGGFLGSLKDIAPYMNDLWKFDGTNWTWVTGSSSGPALGVYGTRGLPAPTNSPGARVDASAWVDAAGSFYLFGGYGQADGSQKPARIRVLNDLWRFEPATGLWTWLHGSTISEAPAVYGVKGVPSITAVPSARQDALTTVGNDGLLYLFGGFSTGSSKGYNNDLWRYSPSTNTWCWLSGANKPGAIPVIGTRGLPDSLNEPGIRSNGAAWTAPDGQIMIFSGLNTRFDEVWSYRPETRQWTWLKGSTTTALKPVYGTLGQAAASITPGGRINVALGTDAYGNPWTFGGANVSSDIYADLFKLTLIPAPSAETFPAEDVTYFSATLQGTVSPNGTPMTSSIRYGKQPDLSDAVSTPEQDAGSDNGRVGVYEEIYSLEPGTRYFFQVVGTTQQGTVRGPLRSFVTTDTAAPGRTVQFVSAGSSVVEKAGFANVIVTLSSPQSTPLTIPVSSTGTASLGQDYTAPATSVIFAAGQMQALLSVPILDDKVVDPGKTLTFTIGTLPSGITLGSPATHTLTIDDDEQTISIAGQPKDQFIALRDTLNLSVVATGAGPLTYQWKKNNAKIAGATLPTFTVHNATSAVAGLYQCDVTNPLGTVPSAIVKVFILDPAALNVTVAPGKPNTFTVNAFGPTGTVFDYQWTKDNGVTVSSTKDFKLTATQAADTGSYTCLVTVPLADGIGLEGGTHRLTVTSAPALVFPTATYLALGARDPNVGENLGARVDLTTTGPGTYTAKLTTNGVNAASVTGKLAATLTGSTLTAASGSADFIRVGRPTLRLSFSLNIAANTLTGTLTDVSSLASEPINGFRNIWSKTTPQATNYAGAYNFALEIPELLFGNSAVPQGDGYGSFTVGTEGLLICAGDTADGLGYTSAGFVGPTGQVPVYAVCKAPGGTLLGTAQIGVATNLQNNTLTGTLSWNRAPEPATSKGVTYRAGLAPLDLTVIGGKYKPAPAGGVVRGLVNADDKAALNFFAAGLTDLDLDGADSDLKADTFVFSIRNTGTALAQTIKLPDAKDKLKNYNQVTFTLPAAPNGLFIGSFLIPNVTPTLVRKASFKGIIVWDGSSYLAPGYFLLPQTPQPGETTPPILSGQVLLEPNP